MIGFSKCSSVRLVTSRGVSALLRRPVAAQNTRAYNATASVSTVPDSVPPQTATSSDSTRSFVRMRRKSNFERPGQAFDRNGTKSDLQENPFQKHEDDLGKLEINTVYDFIDRLEWKNFLLAGQLFRGIKLLREKSFDVSALSDRQVALLISGAGGICDEISASERMKCLGAILRVLQEHGVKLELKARNALLNARLDNMAELNVPVVLKEFEDAGIEPDVDTYSALSRVYARKGDVVGLMSIVNHMKELGLSANQQLLDSLVYALSFVGRDKEALAVIESARLNKNIGDLKLKFMFALAKSKTGDRESAVQMLESLDREIFEKMTYSKRVVEILIATAERGDREGFEKLLSFLPTDNDGKLGNRPCQVIVVSKVKEFCSLGSDNIEAALMLYKILPEYLASQLLETCKEYFIDLFRRGTETSRIVTVAALFADAGLLKNPLEKSVEMSLVFHRAKFCEFFKYFYESDECKRLGDRFHLRFPFIVQSLNSVTPELREEEKAVIFADIAKTFYRPEAKFEWPLFQAWLFWPIYKNINALPAMLALLNERIKQIFVSSFWSAAFALQKELDFRILEELADGSLKDVGFEMSMVEKQLAYAFAGPVAMKKTLDLATKLLSHQFQEPEKPYRTPSAAMNVVEKTLLLVDNERAAVLINKWLENDRIRFAAQDIATIAAKLVSHGMTKKAEFLSKLQRKSQALSRWRGSNDLKALEEEATFIAHSNNPNKHLVLDSLLSVIFTKRLEEEPLSHESFAWIMRKYCEVPQAASVRPVEYQKKCDFVMNYALGSNNLEIADLLWKNGSVKYEAFKFRYAALLHQAQRLDSVEEVLRTVTVNMGKENVANIANFIGESSEKLQFLKFLAKRFDLNSEQKAILLSRCRKATFDRLLAEHKLDEAFAFANDVSVEKGYPYGGIDLMTAALDADRLDLLKNVVDLTEIRVGRTAALLDFGVALLEKNRKNEAARVFSTRGLDATAFRINVYIKREVKARRADVLVEMFMVCHDKKLASEESLGNLLIAALDLYGEAMDSDGIETVKQCILQTSFPVDNMLKMCIKDNVSKMKDKHTDVNLQSPAKE